jgi:hypothetical protein
VLLAVRQKDRDALATTALVRLAVRDEENEPLCDPGHVGDVDGDQLRTSKGGRPAAGVSITTEQTCAS